MASFFARRTMFSIMAPELKSLKYRISLSPEAYVTSRNRLPSRRLVHLLDRLLDHAAARRAGASPPLRSISSGWIGHRRVQVLRHDVLGLGARRGARS